MKSIQFTVVFVSGNFRLKVQPLISFVLATYLLSLPDHRLSSDQGHATNNKKAVSGLLAVNKSCKSGDGVQPQ